MPSLPPGKDWNYAFFTFFPGYQDGEHRNLLFFFLSTGLLPIMFALPILVWPFALWVDESKYNNNNDNNFNGTIPSSSTAVTSHASYAIFQFFYTSLACAVMMIGQHAVVPCMPRSWTIITLLICQGAVQLLYYLLDDVFDDSGEDSAAVKRAEENKQLHANRELGIVVCILIIFISYILHVVFHVNNRDSEGNLIIPADLLIDENSSSPKKGKSNDDEDIHNNNNTNTIKISSSFASSENNTMKTVVDDNENENNTSSCISKHLVSPATSLNDGDFHHDENNNTHIETRKRARTLCQQQRENAEKMYDEVCHRKYYPVEQHQHQATHQSLEYTKHDDGGDYQPGNNNNNNNNITKSNLLLTESEVNHHIQQQQKQNPAPAEASVSTATLNNNNNHQRCDDYSETIMMSDSFSSTVKRDSNNNDNNHYTRSARESALVTTATDYNEELMNNNDGQGGSNSNSSLKQNREKNGSNNIEGEGFVDRFLLGLRALHTTKWAQVVAIIVSQGATFGVYQFCLFFTGKFFSNDPGLNSRDDGSNGHREVFLFIIFSVVMEALNGAVQAISRLCDLIKYRRGPSLEMLNSIQMSNFYTVFNRSLFQHIGSWSTLIVLLVLHLAQHFILYPLRLTQWYFDFSSKVQEKFLCVPILGAAIYDESPIDVWRVRLNLDMMTRYVATESSTIAYIVTLVFLQYGWNSKYYAFFANDLPHEDFVRTVVFLSINVVVEVGFLALVHRYFLDLALPLARLCHFDRWYFWAMVLGVAHVTTDVCLVRAVINFP